jgi:hypothetical protein
VPRAAAQNGRKLRGDVRTASGQLSLIIQEFPAERAEFHHVFSNLG